MSTQKFNPQALRQLAEDFFRKVAQDQDIPCGERADLVTSLVRQWITFDGNAALFVGEEQVYLAVGKTPFEEYSIIPQPAPPGWLDCLANDWKIDPDEFPGILEQLNLGQGAEVTNTEGIPLRLWVNPKERSQGVQPLVKRPLPPPGTPKDYRKIAGNELARHIHLIDEKKLAALADAVAKQWQRFHGHASIFLDEGRQVVLKLTEQGNGGCNVLTTSKSSQLNPFLSSLGFSPGVIPDVVAHINLGQKVEFRDKDGLPSVLWHDPKEDQIVVRSIRPRLCPKCAAVLKPWGHNQRQQECLHCGTVVSLS